MSKVRDLPEITTLEDNDLFYAVDSSAGVNGGAKITKVNLKESVSLSASEIKTRYESNADTNAFTDAEKASVADIPSKLDKSGGTMSGNINMDGSSITNLPSPTADSEPATKFYVDSLAGSFGWKTSVLSKSLSNPPLTPGVGERYIIASPATGLWFGFDGHITQWDGSVWEFIEPLEGDTVVVLDVDAYFHYESNINTWLRIEEKMDHGLIQGLLDDDHPQYLPVDGSRAMSGSLDMDSNTIVNSGTINGVNITAHGSRHNPGGADPISTATAVGLDANSTSTEGNGTSVARNNHTHAISTGVVSTQLADQSNSVGSSANLAKADHIHQIPTAAPVATGTANSQGVATSFAKSDHVHNTVIASSVVSSVITGTTTSVTDVVIVGMTVTPAAGTYLARFCSSTVNSGNGAERNFVSIYSGGSQVPYSEVRLGISGGGVVPVTTIAQVTVNGSQAVEARWRVIAGTGSMYQRSLILTRLS